MHSLFCRKVLLMQPDILTRRLFVTPSLLPVPLPDRRETHFWYVVPEEVQNKSILNGYLELISPSERESVLRMNGEKLQKSALLARALVRTTLARYTDGKVCPRALRFRKNRFGKPEVDWQNVENWVPPSLNFNVSHSSSLIACGVTIDMQIGIDVEEKLRQLRNNVPSFAQRYFSSHEVNFLQSFSNPDIQRQEFIKLWTLKEAYVKALGRGFSAAPFKDFTIQFKASNITRFQRQPGQVASKIVVEACGDSKTLTSDWQFALFELANSHYAAICMEKEDGIAEGGAENSLKLKVWKTIPFVKDECVSGTDAVVAITGFC